MAKNVDQLLVKIDSLICECEQLTPDDWADFSHTIASTAITISDLERAMWALKAATSESSRIMTYASNLIGMIEKIEELEVKAVTVGITKDEIAAIKEIAERESINTEIEYYAIMERRLVARIEAKIHGE